MPFTMGTPFSPDAIRLVQNQQQMQMQQQQANSRRRVREPVENDSFKYAQLKASTESDKAEREMRKELALISQNMQQAQTEQERLRWEREFDLKKQVFEDRVPEADKFEADKELKEKGLAVDERRVAAVEKTNQLREDIEFGGDPSVVGSKAWTRKTQGDKNVASSEQMRARSEEITRRIAGTLPDQLDARTRTVIMGKHQEMLERAMSIKREEDAYDLAIDLMKASRNPITGMLDVEGGQRALSSMMGSIQGLVAEKGGSFLRAFNAAFEKSVSDDQATAATTKNEKATAPAVPKSQQPGSLRGAMGYLDELRRQSQQQAPPPSNVGR